MLSFLRGCRGLCLLCFSCRGPEPGLCGERVRPGGAVPGLVSLAQRPPADPSSSFCVVTGEHNGDLFLALGQPEE